MLMVLIMDEIVKKLAALGLPGVIVLIMVATAEGVERHVALPVILATLGGPFGIMGGLAGLGIMTLVTESLAEYGIEALLTAVYTERGKKQSLNGIVREINELPISDALKHKLTDNISNNYTQEKELVVVPQVKEIE
jgi:hypothetical protein